MKTIDFNKNDFPLTTTVLGFMQAAYQMAELLSGIVGPKYVLSGCGVVGSSVNAGMVVIDGEIMPFDGGIASTYVRVITTPTTVNIQDGSYTKTEKRLVFGSGSGQFAWADVKRFDSLLTVMTNLTNKVDKVAGKGLSEQDFTTALKNKLDGLSAPPFSISNITNLQQNLDNKQAITGIHIFQPEEGDATYQLPNTHTAFLVPGGVVGSVIDAYLPTVGGIVKSGSIIHIAWAAEAGYSETLRVYAPTGHSLYPGSAIFYKIGNQQSITFLVQGTTYYPIAGYINYDE